ncbi:RING finger protein [Patulibacter sp. NPDC049589]|uniref:RING finger protein n=1 Tax=Patulibacter sp. NPDC049589 TaxID=3154731 RepID=UPI003443A8A3
MGSQPPGLRAASDADTGTSCPYCRFAVKPGTTVAVCPACSSPHHADCWSERGGCAVGGCVDTTATVVGPFAAPEAASWAAAPPPPTAPPGSASRPRSSAPIVGAIVVLAIVIAGAATAVVLSSSGDDAAPAAQVRASGATPAAGGARSSAGSDAPTAEPATPPSSAPSADAGTSVDAGAPAGAGTAASGGAPETSAPDSPADPPRSPAAPLTAAERAEASGPTIYLAQLAALTSRSGAQSEVARMARLGVPGAQVLRSDDFVGMLPGYWIVYDGFYDDKPRAKAAATAARRAGAAHAFTRAVARR